MIKNLTIYLYMWYVAVVVVSFKQSTYSVREDEGSVQLTLVLSNTSSYDISVRVVSAAYLNNTDTTTYATGNVV